MIQFYIEYRLITNVLLSPSYKGPSEIAGGVVEGNNIYKNKDTKINT